MKFLNRKYLILNILIVILKMLKNDKKVNFQL